MVQQVLPWLIVLAVAAAVVSDVRGYIIPNWIPATIAALALVQGLALGLGLAAWPYLACGFAVLVVGFALFAFNLMGAGDVKLLAALALWAGPAGTPGLIFWTALGGGGLAIVVLVADRLRRVNSVNKATAGTAPETAAEFPSAAGDAAQSGGFSRGRPLPYAAAIACGGVYLLVHGLGLA